MRIVAEKGLLAAISLLLALNLHAQTDATLVAALLAAVCATSVAEWLAASRWGWLPSVSFALAAVFLPLWRAFLPLVAYDAGRMPPAPHLSDSVVSAPGTSGHHATATDTTEPAKSRSSYGLAIQMKRSVNRLAPLARWMWTIPLAAALTSTLTGTGTLMAASTDHTSAATSSFTMLSGEDHPMMPVTFLALLTCVGFAWGADSRRATSLTRQVRHLRDSTRESTRTHRLRLADVAEERAQAVRMATLGERTRIAREIHDNVGHLLTRAIMQAQAGRAVADATGDTVAVQEFDSLGGTLHDAMTMVRRSVHDLEDDGTDFAAQIGDAVRSFDGVSPGFSVRLTSDIDSAPAPVTRCFATVIREALSNVVHHSEACEATVTLRDMPALWQLVVQDPGPAAQDDGPTDGLVTGRRTAGLEGPNSSGSVGESTGASPDESQRGMGLADIESRARALGGTSLCGPYGTGWRVFVSIPKARWRSATDTQGAQGTQRTQGARIITARQSRAS
ncbi:two-component system sensor histidine kinase [Bifidobacterium myosotis]|uniref:histidine kinase n=1 Tax=Bifidobacterium myosotis TaxID=1630166 RepID=A0A261FEZ9_9BIFI|nr:histidine kinase [Bifidobacterium myosotis]OZG57712.1 two-component system sensor histidine kinase [Bifidobacterium myosotis]